MTKSNIRRIYPTISGLGQTDYDEKKNGLQLEMSGLIFSRSFIPNVEAVAKQIAASPFFEVSLNPKEKFFLKVALTFLD